MSALRIIAKTLLALILVVLAAAVLVLLFLFLYPSVGQVPDKAEPDSGSDHWANGQFRNANDTRTMTGDSNSVIEEDIDTGAGIPPRAATGRSRKRRSPQRPLPF